MNVQQRTQAASLPANANRRAFWLRQLRQWHWTSAAISLLGTLMFAVTGITLNHAAQIEAQPRVHLVELEVPPPVLKVLSGVSSEGKGALPASLAAWLSDALGITVPDAGEWSEEELYISLPRPGGDAWLSIDRQTGALHYERTDRGWISYLNDLHKGRNAGGAWSLFIDVFAVGCIVFALTGLALLQLYGANRPLTWPLVGLGCAVPILIALFLIH